MRNNADVIILGAGIVGCSIAFALSKRGYKTLNIDALPAAGYGSTSHSSAVIRPIYSHITSCAIAHESRSIWKEWENFIDADDERGYAKYSECGGLVLVKDDDFTPYQSSLDAMSAVGVQFDILNERQIRESYPGIALDAFGPPRRLQEEDFGEVKEGRITSAILVEAAGYVSDPQLASHNLQIAAQNRGAEFLFNQKVVKIEQSSDEVKAVCLQNGERLAASIVINATGPHSKGINQLAGIELKINTQSVKHEVAYLEAPSSHFSKTEKFIVDFDAGVYTRPDGKDILIGSADPECDVIDVVDPDDYDAGFTEQWTVQAYRTAQRFPDLGISNTARGTVGIYDVSEDWIPIYDRSELNGFYLAMGTSGNQFKNAPLIGEIMAQIIEQDGYCSDHVGRLKSGVDGGHDTNPATLYLAHIDRNVCLDFFSRNRQLQSTSTVLA